MYGGSAKVCDERPSRIHFMGSQSAQARTAPWLWDEAGKARDEPAYVRAGRQAMVRYISASITQSAPVSRHLAV